MIRPASAPQPGPCTQCTPADLQADAQGLMAEEPMTALTAHLDGRPNMARPIGPVHRLYRWARRKPGLAGAIGTSLVLLAALAAVSFQFAVVQKRLRCEAETNANLYREAARRSSNETDFARNLFISGIRKSEIFQKELNQIGGQVSGAGVLAEKVQASNQAVMQQYATRLQMAGDLGWTSPDRVPARSVAIKASTTIALNLRAKG